MERGWRLRGGHKTVSRTLFQVGEALRWLRSSCATSHTTPCAKLIASCRQNVRPVQMRLHRECDKLGSPQGKCEVPLQSRSPGANTAVPSAIDTDYVVNLLTSKSPTLSTMGTCSFIMKGVTKPSLPSVMKECGVCLADCGSCC